MVDILRSAPTPVQTSVLRTMSMTGYRTLEPVSFLRLLWRFALKTARVSREMGGVRVVIFVLVVRDLSLVRRVKER